MANTDLELKYKQETGKYPSEENDLGLRTYTEWLERKLEQIQNENYRLKKELNLKTNYNHELRTRH